MAKWAKKKPGYTDRYNSAKVLTFDPGMLSSFSRPRFKVDLPGKVGILLVTTKHCFSRSGNSTCIEVTLNDADHKNHELQSVPKVLSLVCPRSGHVAKRGGGAL